MANLHPVVGEPDRRFPNGTGRFTPDQARAFAYFAKEEFRPFYGRMFFELAKQQMWELHLLFSGTLVDDDGTDHGLELQLSAEQQEGATAAFRILWSIIRRARLERSAFGSARSDETFQGFLRAATQRRRRRQ